MGNKVATFSEQQLEDYQDTTFFSRKEILRVHRRFRELQPELVPRTMSMEATRDLRLPKSLINTLPELKENPFRDRILKVFSSNGSGDLSFDDFLDLLSVFSEHAPRELKLHYAFRIYDMDGDGVIGPSDLKAVIGRLCQHERGLTPAEIDAVVEQILDEADVDCDGYLTAMEFSHVVARAPDFVQTFHIRI
ncbi:Protein CIB2 [Daphnia magna]|uniref:Protein CIB2 n=1 Tax=Daphnia magna TaxID=35525 RepID=A0A164K940_9CRUS|nr:Protein CIB2 [Daphnia magna]